MSGDQRVEIGSRVSLATREGAVEINIDGHEMVISIAKARELHRMLGQAIEAAMSDALLVQFLAQKVGASPEAIAMALLDIRELRQGSRGTVYRQ